MKKLSVLTMFLSQVFLFCLFSSADEGMWLFTNAPKDQIQKEYGYTLTPDFLEHLQKSSIRFGNGGSASFVSSNGLVMTNHHVAVSTLQKLSSKSQDLVQNGFYAKTLAEELKCPDVELIVLMQITDVTETVNQSVTEKMTPTEAEAARRAIINQIEQVAAQKTGLDKCEVITLYQGGLYHLYCYKKFTDVRLVFAPENSVGFFGGEPDNFEYPRYNLDVAFFRVYENNKPYQAKHFLRWSQQGAQNGELVFVSGHPARTDRFRTIDHLSFQQDVEYPYLLNKLRRREVLLQIFSEKNADNARRVSSELFRIRNSRKNRTGILSGLQDPKLITQKFNDDEKLYNQIVEKNLIDMEKNNPWEKINTALQTWEEIYIPYDLLEKSEAFNCQTYKIARNIVRYVIEKEKPSEKRLREFQDLNLEAMKANILSVQSIEDDIEILKLTDSLGMYVEYFAENEYANGEYEGLNLLANLSPKDRAVQLLKNTKVKNVAERQKLLASDLKTLNESTDPMIQLALLVEEPSRILRTVYDEQVAEPLRQAYAQIAQVRFLVNGTSVYPDATFTLRLSYGKVAGYVDDNGKTIPPWTTLQGTFDHAAEHNNVYPYNLPQSWLNNKSKVNLKTPINIVTTNDIIGGNSGSPLINQRGEVVGLIFDGNVQSLVSNFIYTDAQSRAVSVHSSGIKEALSSIYQATRIVDELGK